MSTPDRFSKWPAFWRYWYQTEASLSRLPMLFLIPAAGAFVGTAWGVSHPSETIREGLVVSQASFWGVLLSTLIGGIVGVALLMALVWGYAWFRYRCAGGDGDWEAVYEGSVADRMFFELRCKAALPIDPATLGAQTCLVKTPNGCLVEAEKYGPRLNPPGYTAHFALTPLAGDYEARWYAARGKARLQEVARFKGAAPTDTMPSLIKPISG
jgi:hypothetical protein